MLLEQRPVGKTLLKRSPEQKTTDDMKLGCLFPTDYSKNDFLRLLILSAIVAVWYSLSVRCSATSE